MDNQKKGTKYNAQELELVCLAGLRVCEDSLNGTGQRKRDLEAKMERFYQEVAVDRQVPVPFRDGVNLWRKFKDIGREVTKFQGSYTQAESTLPSGHSDVLARVKKLFKRPTSIHSK